MGRHEVAQKLEYFYGVEKPKTGAPGVRPFNKEVPGLAQNTDL